MSSASVSLDDIGPGLKLRFDRTLAFMRASDVAPRKILDLGPENTFSQVLRLEGYEVVNTGLVDLDVHPEIAADFDVDCVTSFELFEHLLAPYNVLRHLPKVPMFATVPLRLWFATAYRNPTDEWDRHYHEFESWQFDWLLDKAGWSIDRTDKWTSPTPITGIRPLLRRFWPRYYAVEAHPTSTSTPDP
ncbi:MAG: methyltransferase [Rhodothermales bacterium]